MVLLRNSRRDSKKGDKMKPKWLGPYIIVESLGKSRYRLKNPHNNNILKNSVYSVRLKPYKPLCQKNKFWMNMVSSM